MLRWALTNGEKFTAAQKQAAEDGTEIPEELLPPDLIEGFGGWYEDFWTLSTERQIGMAEGEIPASAIAKHVEGWRYDDAEMFEHCMRQMDRVYLRRGEEEKQDQPEVSARDAFRSATANRRER